ncbi:ArnT family glycosyltransferase [Paenibacillus chitinolyticus]|uniref:ArnT family glycosyltransferase n=1 Tax=Paenibacillus chitinolyticus TaxID=79263 RepID=UPI003867E692
MEHKTRIPAWLITALLFIAIAALRIPYITNSPYEIDSWRQSDTESIARHFVETKFNLFYPQFNYQGPLPNYVELEFQITPFLIAILYKLFGYQYWLARLVPLAFFMGSAWFLYLIARSFYTKRTAWIAVLLYGILPVAVTYSRAIMPEAASLFFYLGAFYAFTVWIRKGGTAFVLTAALFTALAISLKVPTIFVGIPMLFMAAAKFKGKMVLNWRLWLFAVLALGLPALYYAWASSIAEFQFVSGIATKHIFPKMATALFTPETWDFFLRELPKAFSWPLLALAAAGLLAGFRQKDIPVRVWGWAMLLELATIVAVIKFDYYLIFFAPVAALLAAKTIGRLAELRFGWIPAAVVVAGIGWACALMMNPDYGKEKTVILEQARAVERLTKPGDLIVVGTDDPSLLNASHRVGWRVLNSIPDDPVKELEYFRAGGAAYFVPLKGQIDGDKAGELRRYLNAKFEKIPVEGGYDIYRLN